MMGNIIGGLIVILVSVNFIPTVANQVGAVASVLVGLFILGGAMAMIVGVLVNIKRIPLKIVYRDIKNYLRKIYNKFEY